MPNRNTAGVHRPALLIHGGAGSRVTGARRARIRRHLRLMCEDAYRFLQGHSALESVRFAVQHLEDAPFFNAGTGSVLQQDGHVRMSASIMDGATMRFAGVVNIERVKNPVLIADALLGRPEMVLAGAGAVRFARSLGFRSWDPVTPERLRQWRHGLGLPYGTVGAVAVDTHGHLAAATSSGGRALVWPGRVSDSGIPPGNYANERAAVSCTGVGEDIVHEGLAVRIVQRVLDGLSLRRAFALTFRELTRRQRAAAAIGVDREGHLVWATTLPVLFAVGCTPAGCVESF